MRSICLYSSYFNGPAIPYYVRFYLEQLRGYFTSFVFITNEKELDDASRRFLKENDMELMTVINEGWDFGMWYKAMQTHDPRNFDRLALVNDSCILFRKPEEFMQWADNNGLDYYGMSDSNAVSYHIQSFFLMVSKKAIPEVYSYFTMNGILKDVKEVIRVYEIGLSRYLAEKGFRTGAMFSTKDYAGEFSPMLLFAKELISKGLPLIKKKILFASFRPDEYRTLARMNMDIDPQGYMQHIKETQKGKEIIDLSRLEKGKGLSGATLLRFRLSALLFRIARKLKDKS